MIGSWELNVARFHFYVPFFFILLMNLEAVERLFFFAEIGVSALVLWFNFVKTCGCREKFGK